MTRAVTLAEIAEGNTFIVDSTNNRVGIASTIPTTTLDVGGAVKATSFTGNITGNATGLTGTPDIAVRNITGVAATFTGVLTYEDVTNIDSVGIITARSDVSIADKIVHTGDTNTAIRFPANDTFTVETGGSERLRVTSTGLLDVSGGIQVSENITPTSGSGIEILKASSTVGLIQAYNRDSSSWMDFRLRGNQIELFTAGSERLRITSAGKVGINQLTPTAFMHVKSGANDGTVISTFEGATNNKLDVKFISSGPAINVTAGDPLAFEIGGSEKLRILSGGGITFNGDTSAANALNDYEEGSWTPSLGGNASYDIRVGTYTKIGNIVYAYCRIRPTSLGTGSDDTISGLPFNPNGSDNSGVMIGYYDGSAVSSVELGGVLNTNGSITLYTKTSATNNTGTTTFFQNNCRIYLSTVYQTDS